MQKRRLLRTGEQGKAAPPLMFARADVCDDQRRVDVRGHRGAGRQQEHDPHRFFPRTGASSAGSWFLSMVVDYKHKIGFKGPKPQEPTKHQYDFDVATIAGFLRRFGLEREVKLNIEVGHAVHHPFEHEVALAASLVLL